MATLVAVLYFLAITPIWAQPVTQTSRPTDSTDISAAGDQIGEQTTFGNTAIWIASRMRSIVAALIMVALVFAGLAFLLGNSRLAWMVAASAVFLFGGFWILAVIAGPFELAQRSQFFAASYDYPVAQGLSPAADAFSGVLAEGLRLLSVAVTPFVIIYGSMMAINNAISNEHSSAIPNFLLGTVVIYSAGALAQLFMAISA